LKRICIVQPILTHYTLPVFEELASRAKIDLLYSPSDSTEAFADVRSSPNINAVELAHHRPFGTSFGMWQSGILGHLRQSKPDAVLIFANPRYLSFWWTLLFGKLLAIKVLPHGHGIYRKRRISWPYRLMHVLLIKLSHRYICYTESVRKAYLDQGFDGSKLCVGENSQPNPASLPPSQKPQIQNGLLFVGRLREQTNLEWLFEAAEVARQETGKPLTLQIIGSGTDEARLCEIAKDRPWIVFHGAIYDEQRIAEISKPCFAGCYPGTAGLSVVHMMSLSLPPIIHDEMTLQGPEASYVNHGINGFLFEHSNPIPSLTRCLTMLLHDLDGLKQIQQNAFNSYQSLIDPSLADRLYAAMAD
jgi:glycosyltransferase involved in cell wall biosynthesis